MRTLTTWHGDEKYSNPPFHYVGNVLTALRDDQVPRFLGALTHPDILPLESVRATDLTALQNRVHTEGVMTRAASGEALKPAVVVRFNGRSVIADGHHAAAAAWVRGQDQLQVRVKDLEPFDNAMKSAKKSVDDGASVEASVVKVDSGLGVVFGWAIVCKIDGRPYVDLQGEHIPEDVMLKAAVDYMGDDRAVKEMHVGPDLIGGKVLFAFPVTTEIAKAFDIPTAKTGLIIGMKPNDDGVLAKFRSGEYTGFSIGGSGRVFDDPAIAG